MALDKTTEESTESKSTSIVDPVDPVNTELKPTFKALPKFLLSAEEEFLPEFNPKPKGSA